MPTQVPRVIPYPRDPYKPGGIVKHRKLVVVVMLAMALTIGMASGATPAYAASTSSRLKSLERSVKTFKSQIDNLFARIAALEARAGVPGPAGPAGPAGPKGDVGPSAAAAFWPSEAASMVDPTVVMCAYAVVDPEARTIVIDLYPTATQGSYAHESYMKITTDKGTYTSTGGSWDVSLDTVGADEMPTEGSDITVEYWISQYGVNRHGTQKISGWTYDATTPGTSGVGMTF
jgi:hypothetical protein